VRTMLEAIISFLPSEGAGAIGALDWTPRERRKLAEEVCVCVRDHYLKVSVHVFKLNICDFVSSRSILSAPHAAQ
jgi:hypothetical protein